MLDMLRRRSSFVYVIFGAVLLMFALNLGPNATGCTHSMPATWAAKVNGEIISPQEYFFLYQRQLAYIRQMAESRGTDVTDSLLAQMGLHDQVLGQLIEHKLLTQEAKKMGLQVDDAQLLTYLREQVGVQDVGYDTYENWVQQTFQINVDQFEERTRQDLAAKMLADTLEEMVTVGDAELSQSYQEDHDRAKIIFSRFDVDPTAQKTPEAKVVESWLMAHEPEVVAYHKEHLGSYRTPYQIHAQQILLTLPTDADAEAVAKAEQLMHDISMQLANGGDFAQLATQYSQDTATAQQGGDLGFLQRGHLVKVLDDALFSLKQGQVTEKPIRSPQGLHLLRAHEVKIPEQREFGQIKHEVAVDMLRLQAADSQSRTQATALLTALQAGKSWQKLTVDEDAEPLASQVKKPVRRQSPWILHTEEAIGRIGLNHDLHQDIFAAKLTAPLLQKVYHVGSSYYVVALAERETPDMSKFAEQKAELKEQAVEQKRNQVVRDWLTYLRSQAKVQENRSIVGPMTPTTTT